MGKNKTGKYLKYAIGEIVLVVVGILIALQINNWNEKRIQLVQGQTLMLELIEEIKVDISMCNWAIKNLEISIEKREAIFKVKDLGSIDLDSLSFFFSDANVDIKIDANTHDKIKNRGITFISGNEVLNNEINEYFDRNVNSFNRSIQYFWNNQKERWKYLADQNSFMFNSDLVQGFENINIEKSRSNFIKFINLPRTRNNIETTYYQNKGALETVIYFKEESISLLEKIHAELLKSNPELKPLPNFDIDQDLSEN